MIHALRMFAVNTFGDIGLISGRALHQVGSGVCTSRCNRMAKTGTYFNLRPKQLQMWKQNASSNICAKLDPNWTDQGDTWVSYLYLTPSFFECLWNETDLGLSLRGKKNDRHSKLECECFLSLMIRYGLKLFFEILMGFEFLSPG